MYSIDHRHVAPITILAFAMLAIWPLLMSGITQAQDIIGVYFDQEGTSVHYQTTQLEEDVQAWVVLKEMSSNDDLDGVAFRLEVNGVGVSWLNSLIGGQNTGDDRGNFVFNASPPIPRQEHIIICYGNIRAATPDDRREIYIQSIVDVPFATPSYHTVAGDVIPLGPSSGSLDEPVAIINPDGEVTSIHSTWGEIKSVYK